MNSTNLINFVTQFSDWYGVLSEIVIRMLSALVISKLVAFNLQIFVSMKLLFV